MMPGSKPQAVSSEERNNELTFKIAVVGIGSVLFAFVVAVTVFHGSKHPGEVIPAVLGVITAAIGTLAGLVAGHAAGAAGKAKSDERATDNERDAAAGRALARTMVVDGQHHTGQASAHVIGSGPAPASAGDLADRHAKLAQSLFPDLAQ